MSFRDELDAARTRRDALRRAVETSGDPEVARELAAVRARIDEARGRAALKVLQDVRVATPCPASWAAMVGDDAVRHCALCEKNVYDFSGLTAMEAVHLLVANEGNVCVRLHRRRDGTLITADCQVGRRRRRKRWLQGAAASLAIGGVTVALASEAVGTMPPELAPRSYGAVMGGRAEFDEEAFRRGPPVPAEPTPIGEYNPVLDSHVFGSYVVLSEETHERLYELLRGGAELGGVEDTSDDHDTESARE